MGLMFNKQVVTDQRCE